MKIFITGATGFVGRHVVNQALAAGHELVALARDTSSEHFVAHPRLKWVNGTLADVCIDDFLDCEGLIHLAAYGVLKGMNDWDNCFRVNVTESLALWQKAVSANIKRHVICGSCFEYGRTGESCEFISTDAPLVPTAAYHASKAAATMAALGLAVDKQLETKILRPFQVYGEGEAETRFWPSLRKAALAGQDFPMTAGEQIRDFVPVQQVATEFLNAVLDTSVIAGNPVIANVGSANPQSLADFASYWWREFGAVGHLQLGKVAYRNNEVMRYVPKMA